MSKVEKMTTSDIELGKGEWITQTLISQAHALFQMWGKWWRYVRRARRHRSTAAGTPAATAR